MTYTLQERPKRRTPGRRATKRLESSTRARPTEDAGAIDWERIEPRGLYARFGRAAFDTLLLVVTMPPVLVLGALVAFANLLYFRDPRQVLYVQPRVGRRGRVFQIYKFRTMREASTTAHDSWANGQDQARVTRLGKFLRSSHLDELPQVLNILRGEMTFIGPRPEMVEVEQWASEHVPGFTKRLVLKPGITGYAQITQGYTGRCAEAYARKLELTEIYRSRMSLRADVEILGRTLLWMLHGRGWRWNVGARGAEAGERAGDGEPLAAMTSRRSA